MSVGQNLAIQTPSGIKHGFRYAAMTNLRIVGALMMREGMLRYGHESLGFFWVMGEPLFLTCGVMGMWTITGATHGHGVGVVPFALSGYMMITLWRHLSGRAVHSIRTNAGLLFHRNVRLLDIMIARGMLEVLGIFTAFFIAWVPLTLLGVLEPMSDPLAFVAGYLLQGWFSFAVGLIIAGLSEMFAPVEQFVPPILYITLPFTGIFTMAAWIPQQWREYLLWSPLVSNVEMLRGGMFPADTVTYSYPLYVVLWCVVLTAIGVPLVHKAYEHVSFG
jgi:capsular polysaccharide transport system permease protein